MKYLKRFKFAAGILAIVAVLLGIYYLNRPHIPAVKIRDRVFKIELAVTDAEKEKGLGYRDTLPADSGMLFLFRDKTQYSFWMKGMRFPLDIIWILDDTIVDITHNAPVATGTEMPSYIPKSAVNKVLEINAGLAGKYGIQIGDTVTTLR